MTHRTFSTSLHEIIGGELAPSLGGRTKISPTKFFQMTFFRKKFPF